MSNTKNRFHIINQRIHQAIKARNQTLESSLKNPVTLLAVSKRHSLDKIQALYELGQRDFGESYLQEALSKIKNAQQTDIIWHFIGPIQSNKTKEIAQNFQWVHSVDRVKIAHRLSLQHPYSKPALNICLQVNISQETQKSGFTCNEINSAISEIIHLPNLNIRGLMAIPKPVQELEPHKRFALQRQPFLQLRKLLQQLNHDFGLNMDTLSMGMSNDLEAAIAEGASIIRIGTALFGPREK